MIKPLQPKQKPSVLVTGGAGFIGSHLVDLLLEKGYKVVVLDALTYAGNRHNLQKAESSSDCTFIQGDINDEKLCKKILYEHQCVKVFHLAAESHVDNSIEKPGAFITTNIVGTYHLLNAVLAYWNSLTHKEKFLFVHVSTDEVYGSLGLKDPPFQESTAYAPHSPYSASKAASDHLVSAWYHTYGLPMVIAHCSNIFGTRQHKEKFIPTIIRSALQEQLIPVYGNGGNRRSWLSIKDACNGLYRIAEAGKPGEQYGIGGKTELANVTLAKRVCVLLDQKRPRTNSASYEVLIRLVTDRLGHDWRYAMLSDKAEKELGYKEEVPFEKALAEAVGYYCSL